MAFVEELAMFESEAGAAQQYFYGFLALQIVPAKNPAVLRQLNETPAFWITTRYALLLSAFVALGRIFDQDNKSIHNIDRLMREVTTGIAMFSQTSLEHRRIEEGMEPGAAKRYAQGTYDLTNTDVRGMRKVVKKWRAVYDARYRDIRHGVFAHRGLSRADADALMALTNIEEMKEMLGFLHSLHNSLWELHANGKKPDLTPVKFDLLPRPREFGASLKAGERVYRQGADLMFDMLSADSAAWDGF